MASVQWYADCIRNGDDPAAVLQVALAEQRDIDARIAERLHRGMLVPGQYPRVYENNVSEAIRGQAPMHLGRDDDR